jgi:type II secretory pathway pseudopilin PulG
MKSYSKPREALTLLEVLIVITMICILAGMLFPAWTKGRRGANRIRCVSNLKQIGLAFRIYSGDNGNRFPMNIATTSNLSAVVNETTAVSEYFRLNSNTLGTPFVLVCPEDKDRKMARDFASLNNSNVSYFIGLDANETFPQAILAGDRNITNGFPLRNGILDLTTNQPVGFTAEIHNEQGDIALGDGSVQQVSSARLRSEIVANSPFATNRIKLP